MQHSSSPASHRPEPEGPGPAHISAPLLRLAQFLSLLLLIVAAHLAGCGGGDPDDDPATPTPRVDCTAHPELCK